MSAAQHTPVPWFKDQYGKVTCAGHASHTPIILDGFALTVSGSEEAQANTDHIIRCVNSHDGLLAALKAARGYLTNAAIDLQTGVPKKTALATVEGGIGLVSAAIAKARGEV